MLCSQVGQDENRVGGRPSLRLQLDLCRFHQPHAVLEEDLVAWCREKKREMKGERAKPNWYGGKNEHMSSPKTKMNTENNEQNEQHNILIHWLLLLVFFPLVPWNFKTAVKRQNPTDQTGGHRHKLASRTKQRVDAGISEEGQQRIRDHEKNCISNGLAAFCTRADIALWFSDGLAKCWLYAAKVARKHKLRLSRKRQD